jgi:ParB family chromosome partitioning protein
VSVPASAGSEEGEVISIQAVAVSANVVEAIDLSLIDRNPYQTRYIFDADLLEELAESIKTNGVVQPIVVRPGPEAGRYVLVLGERRLRASKLAGRTTIPALVRRLSLQQAAEMTVLENVQRQDLNAIEQAEAFRVLSNEFNLTQVEIAKRIGVSRESVSNYMRLLRLPEEVMQLMLDGQLSFSDAREILSLDDDANIPILAKEAVEKKLKLDQIEERVREMNGFVAMQKAEGAETRAAARRSARWMDPNVRAAQRDMELTLGMRVRIKDRNGKGKITIEYGSVDDYQLLMEMLRGKGK